MIRTHPTLSFVLGLSLLARSPAGHADEEERDKPSAPVPEGYSLVYESGFDDADAVKALRSTDPGAWRHAKEGKDGGALELHRQSRYEYEVRSPFNIALIDGLVFEDFILEVDLQQTGKEYGHRDLCLFFGVEDRSKFYYVHLATKADPNAHNVFIVNGEPRKSFATKTTEGVDWGREVWQKIRLERDTKAGTIKVFWNDMKTPIMLAEDTTFTKGYIGFGSFDDTGKVDNLRIWAPKPPEKKKSKDFFAPGRKAE